MTERLWTAYSTEDGEPWAVFVNGHVDLQALRTAESRAEMIDAYKWAQGDDCSGRFNGDIDVGHYYIRDTTNDDDPDLEPGDVEYPYQFCNVDDVGAMPITGVKFP